jgi:hypothetical protein
MYPGPSGYMNPIIFVFGGIFQIIAAIIELYREDVFHGTVFGSIGCFWIGVSQGCLNPFYMCGFGFLTTGFMIIALRKNIGSVLLFAAATLALFLIGVGLGVNDETILFAGLWTFVIGGILGVYAAIGMLIHETYGILIPFLAPMPEWFPLCCFIPRARKSTKVTSIFGLRFTPSERAYYGAGSPDSSLASADALPYANPAGTV